MLNCVRSPCRAGVAFALLALVLATVSFALASAVAQASTDRACGTSEVAGYNDLHATGVSCRTATRLAVEWRRRAFGGQGRPSVRIDTWRCRLRQERGEGAIVRCSRNRDRLAWYPAPPAAPVPGFQIDLAGPDGAHLECAATPDQVSCLNYSRARAPGRCDYGGDVPSVELSRGGQARLTFACVDEGFHGWERLKSGETFSSGPFACRASATGKTLRCASRVSGFSFHIAASGRVHRSRG